MEGRGSASCLKANLARAIVGTTPNEENELGILEFIHCLVETLDSYFENVCELDLMFNLEKAHL